MVHPRGENQQVAHIGNLILGRHYASGCSEHVHPFDGRRDQAVPHRLIHASQLAKGIAYRELRFNASAKGGQARTQVEIDQ